MSKHKPEWYEVVWTVGDRDREFSKLFKPEEKDIAEAFYKDKIKELQDIPFSGVRIYLTHTNRLYDLLHHVHVGKEGELIT